MTDTQDVPGHFALEERLDDDGVLRVVLYGELDLSVTDTVFARLKALKQEDVRVRVDLAHLDFIDSGGLRGLVLAISDARGDGWDLEILPDLTETVRRVIDLVQLRDFFWPSIA